MSQTVLPDIDPSEAPGERPYEMVWANRTEPAPPTLRFDRLQGWTMQVEGGAEAVLQASRAQNIWNRSVARLRYRGSGKPADTSRIRLVPPQPVELPEGVDSVEMWVYGNRWDWVNPPGTPPVRIVLHLRGADNRSHPLTVDTARWEEWWLLHRRLPVALRFPARLESIEVAGGWQPEWREIFFDSIRFYKESLTPLRFSPRPKRNLTLWKGQSPGANTGEGRLSFPTREETILPMQRAGKYRNQIARLSDGRFTLTYTGQDGALRYLLDLSKGLSGIRAEFNGKPVGNLLDGAGVRRADGSIGGAPKSLSLQKSVITAEYTDGTTLRLQIKQKSLIIDVIHRTGEATELSFGQMTGLKEPRVFWMPYITYGGSNPSILLSKAGNANVFTSLWVDWYRSNGSEPYGAEQAGRNTARINGGIRYHPRTDGKRNPLYERLFLTVSPMLEEVLPVVPNPIGLHAKQATDRLWQESWGPDNYETQKKRSRMLRAYGIEKLIQCNHEISWRDGGESFTLRLRAAPKKGGDEALKEYIAHQRGLGWYSGLYTNYTDFAPVNAHWTPDAVQRQSDGEWRSAWPRCWALKPLAAVQFDALLAPQIKAKYNPNSAYTDVHTAVSPWSYNDYDARVPGAGTFAQTFYAYGELLRNDSRVYGGPIFSEGTYQWIYAGLADGNYALAYNGRPLAVEPLLPVFDLYQIHTKECDIGMAWTAFFCDAIPNWRAPESIDRATDRFLLHTLAYGHIGWLVEEEHGIARTCRSYYMLQQVQARYGLKAPTRIAYWDGQRLCSVSEAVAQELPRTRRQLYVEYPGGLQLWLNDHPSEAWTIRAGGQTITLPPAGWAALQKKKEEEKGVGLLSYSAQYGRGKVDYLRSDAYIYLDGRGQWFSTPEAASNGSLAITKPAANRLRIIHISGEGDFVVRRPYGMVGTVQGCRAYNVEGRRLADPITHDSGMETRIEPVKGAVRYELTFSGRPTWSAAPERSEAAPGSAVRLIAKGAAGVHWEADRGEVRGGALHIPPDTPAGTWIALRATAGGESREARVRIVAPVEWRWSRNVPRTSDADSQPDATRLSLLPRWHLTGLSVSRLSVVLEAPEGWEVTPRHIDIDAAKLPRRLDVTLTSSMPAGATGALKIRLTGAPAVTETVLQLARVEQQPVLEELSGKVTSWGIARRGQEESADTPGSGAAFYPQSDLAVGGVVKKGLFMHPPYMGGVGYTWAETQPLSLPSAPCTLDAFVGIRDGGDPSDGVLFRVEVVDRAGKVHRVGEMLGVQREWRAFRADLSAFAGQRVRLRLIADVGPQDNSTADWACWGEPTLRLTQPRLLTEVR